MNIRGEDDYSTSIVVEGEAEDGVLDLLALHGVVANGHDGLSRQGQVDGGRVMR